jgi:hypothetical protein
LEEEEEVIRRGERGCEGRRENPHLPFRSLLIQIQG